MKVKRDSYVIISVYEKGSEKIEEEIEFLEWVTLAHMSGVLVRMSGGSASGSTRQSGKWVIEGIVEEHGVVGKTKMGNDYICADQELVVGNSMFRKNIIIIIIIIRLLLKQDYKIQLANNKIQKAWLTSWLVVG